MEKPSKVRRRSPDPVLTDDLIADILVRLPAKSIGRFRCLSKRWLLFTSSQQFVLAHAALARASSFFLFTSKQNRAEHVPLDPSASISDPALSFLDSSGLAPEFFASCNGLILCRKPHRSSPHKRPTHALYVCNPLTRDCHFIPVDAAIVSDELFLAFDPSVSRHFKVVAIRGGMLGYMYVYSSETQRWKLLNTKLRAEYVDILFLLQRSVVWNGALVWLGSGGTFLALDLQSEEFRRLPLPSLGDEFRCRYFGESRGCLHYIAEPMLVTDHSVTHFDILEMRPGSFEWTVLHRIDLDLMKDVCPEVNARVFSNCEDQPVLRVAIEVACFIRGEGGVGDKLLLSIPRKIVCYDLQARSFTTICTNLLISRYKAGYSWHSLFPHAHTLVPLDNGYAAAPNQDWICWPSKLDKLLMDLMVKQSCKGKKCGFGFKTGAWRQMVRKLNENSLLEFDSDHLYTRMMSYKREYRTVTALLGHEGFNWDPTLQMVVARDYEWNEHIKRNSNVASYRRLRVPYNDLMIICGAFAGSPKISSSKIDNAGTISKKEAPAIQEDDEEIQEVSVPTIRKDNAEEIKDVSAPPIHKDVAIVKSEIQHVSAPTIQEDDGLGIQDVSTPIIPEDDGKEIQDVEAMEDIDSSRKLVLFDDCMEELEAMEDVDNELYVKALLIFKDKYNRRVFLKTKGVKRLMWLRAATNDVNL